MHLLLPAGSALAADTFTGDTAASRAGGSSSESL
jgi:hypothetical protein